MNLQRVASDLNLDKSHHDRYYCPQHDDDTPDLCIDPDRFYCFGGGSDVGGYSPVTLVMHIEECSMPEAVDRLKELYPEEFTELNKREIERRKKATEVLEKATELAHEALMNDRKKIKKRLNENRNFPDELIKDVKIGVFTHEVVKELKESFDKQALIDSGLFIDGDLNEGVYSHLENRIVFPYRFGDKTRFMIGRTIDDHDKEKYKKARTTDYNHHILLSYEHNREKDVLLITEGVTDAISVYHAGYNVISPVTTKFRKEDREKIAKKTKNYDTIYLCMDADEGGRKGASETAKNLVGEGVNPRIIELSDGYDMDDWTTENGYDIEELLDEGEGYLERKLREIKEYEKNDERAKQSEAVEEFLRMISEWDSLHQDPWLRDLPGRKNLLEKKIDEYREANRVDKEKDEESKSDTEEKIEEGNRDEEEVESLEGSIEEMEILSSPDLLSNVNESMHRLGGMKRLIGEHRNVLRIFLNSISAFTTEKPINTFIRGRTSEGKSTMARAVHSLIPDDKKKVLAGASGTAWRRMNAEEKEDDDGNIKKVVDWEEVAIFLLEGDEAREMLEAMKPVLSHDKKEVSYPVTEEVDGEQKVVNYIIRGYPSVTVLATQNFFSNASATRFDDIEPEVGEWKTKKVNEEKAKYKKQPWKYKGENSEELLSSALQHLEQYEVCIPLLDDIEISEYLPHSTGEHNRLADRFFSMVDTITLLHQYQRPRLKVDGDEYLIATKSDLLISAWLMGDELMGIDDDTQRFLDRVLRPVWESEDKNPTYETLENKAEDEGVPHSRNSVTKYLNRLEERSIVNEVEKSSEKGRKYFFPIDNGSEYDKDTSQPLNSSHTDLIGRIRDASISLGDVISNIESGACQEVEDVEGEEEEGDSPIFTLPDIEDDVTVDDNPLFKTISEEGDSFHKGVVNFVNLIGGEVEELLDTLKSPYQTDITGNERLTGSTSSQDEEPIKEQILQVLSETDRDLEKNEILKKVSGYEKEEVEEELHRLEDKEDYGVISPSVNDKMWRMI